MPYIQVNTNIAVPSDTSDTLKTAFGKAIESFPGKTERWLMVEINPERKMYFRGSDASCAIVNVSLFGKAADAAYDKMTAQVTDIVTGQLGIPADAVYVKYEEVGHWGWNGTNF